MAFLIRVPFTPKRRWFAFSLRTLFVVVTVAAAIIAFLASELRWVRERQEFLDRAERDRESLLGAGTYLTYPSIPFWRRWLGDSPQYTVIVPARWPKAELDNARRLFPEAEEVEREEFLELDGTPPSRQLKEG